MDIKLISNNIKFKYRVSCIIVNNNRILFTKYGDKYCLPGGYAEVGETSIEAVKREILEETELNINDIEYLGMIENFFTNIRNEYTHGIDIYYKTGISDEEAGSIDMNYVENDKCSDAIEALCSLGYPRAQILKIVTQLDTQNLNTQDIIRHALKFFAK